MKRIQFQQEWPEEGYNYDKIQFLTDEDRMMASYDIKYEDGYYPIISSVYVQGDFRGKGLTKIMLEDAFEVLKDWDGISIEVHKDNFIRKTYEACGLKFDHQADDNIHLFLNKNGND